MFGWPPKPALSARERGDERETNAARRGRGAGKPAPICHRRSFVLYHVLGPQTKENFMPTENETVMDYRAFLADLEAKRAALDSTINSLRAFLSMGGIGRPGGGAPSAVGSHHLLEIHGGEVPAGAFLGKSIPESAKLYLSIVKSKKTTREIADALRKGGMETSSTNFENIVHAGLNRAMNNASAFLRVGKTWALPEWYPAGVRVAQDRRENRKPRKTKRRRSERQQSAAEVPQKTESGPMTEGHHPEKLWERAVAFISAHPTEEFTANQLSEKFGIHTKVISMTLGRPVKKGLIRMPAPGTYAAVKS